MVLDSPKLHYLELFIASIILLLASGTSLLFFFLSSPLAYTCIVLEFLFFLFAIIYIVKRPKNSTSSDARGYSLFLHFVFVAVVVSYGAIFLTNGVLSLSLLIKAALFMETHALFLVVMLYVFFLIFVGAYFVRKSRKNLRHMLVLFAVVLLVLVLLFFLLTKANVFRADDEELLKLESVRMLFNGTDPYSTSISALLYKNIGTIGSTITSSNDIVGFMDYPALFFLTFVPFYILAEPTIATLNNFYLPLQASVFLFILVMTVAFLLKKKELSSPKLTLIIFFVFAMTNIASFTAYLMLALIILAYTQIDSKYSWLWLGLCLSIQEQLWLPVVFLLAYSLNNHGIRRCIVNIAGSTAVFVIINAYFIAINPLAYFRAVFAPLNLWIMPFNPSPFAFFLLSSFQVPMQTYTILFELLVVLLAIIFLYLNKKELIPIFSLIPFLALTHVLVSYYAFFLFFMFFALSVEQKKSEGIVEKLLRGRAKPFFFAFVMLLIAVMLLTVTSAHASYERNFGIALKNQSIALDKANNATIVNATLEYSNMTNSTVYVFAIVHSYFNAGFVGLINQSLIGSRPECSSYRCLININKIVLPANGSSYPLSLNMPWTRNKTLQITYATIAIYNGPYFYIGDNVRINAT